MHDHVIKRKELLTTTQEISWLPVDYAARAIVELARVDSSAATRSPSNEDKSSDPDLVYHVLNPGRFHWTKQLLPALAEAGLKFESLPTDQWMEKLRNSDRDPTKNPPIKLLGWFESKYGHSKPSSSRGGGLVYLTDDTRRDCEALREVPEVTEVGFVRMMLSRLRTHWDGDA